MRYLLGIFGFIILAIVSVVLLTTMTDNNTTTQTGTPQVSVTSFVNKSATFTMTSQGAITGEEDFQSVVVSVSPSERRIKILTGFNGTVQSEQTFGNTQAGYNVFVNALNTAGYSRERDNKSGEDFSGSCPLGRRFQYQITDNGSQALNLWSTSCGRRTGTFGGDASTVRALYENQIPNYDDITDDVNL